MRKKQYWVIDMFKPEIQGSNVLVKFDTYEEAENFAMKNDGHSKYSFWDAEADCEHTQILPHTLYIKEVFVATESFKKLLEEL